MVFIIVSISIIFILIALNFYRSTLSRPIRLIKEYQNITPLPLSRIPFVGNIHQFGKNDAEFYRLGKKLGDECQQNNKGAFCLWYSLKPMIYLCSSDGLERFINHNKQLVKADFYNLFHDWLKTGLLTSKDEKWRTRRRLITPSFHDNQLLNNFMSIFNEQAKVLANRLARLAKEKKMLEIYPLISTCTLDIITEAATGTKADAQSSEGDNDFVRATIRISEIISYRVQSPWLWPSAIFNLFPIGREHRRVLNILQGFSRRVIEERISVFAQENSSNEKQRTRLVFLDCLIAQMKQEKLTIDDIQEEVDTFMFEGHDTTAAAITFFCYLIGAHPDIQQKVHDEIDSIFGDDHERDCTIDDIQKMTYLDCVIKESMRLLPPVPVIGREAQEASTFVRLVCSMMMFSQHVLSIGDQLIRKGTTVNIFIAAIHRDPNVYPDPDVFDPSRFDETTMNKEQRSPFAFIPFSAGSRNCIGQRFANLEERVVLSTLLRRFSFRSTQTIDELGLLAEMIFRTHNPIRVFLEERNFS